MYLGNAQSLMEDFDDRCNYLIQIDFIHTQFTHSISPFSISFWRYLKGTQISLLHVSHVAFRYTFTGNYFTKEEITLRSSSDYYDLFGWLSLHTHSEMDNWDNYQDNSRQKRIIASIIWLFQMSVFWTELPT